MENYRRRVVKRETYQGAFIDFLYDEYVKTEDIRPFNYWKKIKFEKLATRPKVLEDVDPDTIVSIKRYRIYRARGDPKESLNHVTKRKRVKT